MTDLTITGVIRAIEDGPRAHVVTAPRWARVCIAVGVVMIILSVFALAGVAMVRDGMALLTG